jgi:hypothetical protein
LLRPERISAPDKTALQKLIAAMRKEGLINSKLTIADLVDDSLFQEAQAGVDTEAVKKMARDWQ